MAAFLLRNLLIFLRPLNIPDPAPVDMVPVLFGKNVL